MKITRDTILEEAYFRCLEEMYNKAQPPLNYKEALERKKADPSYDSRENPIYQRHYLSQKEFSYIQEKYAEAYGIKETWKSDINLLIRDLRDGGHKDIYVKEDDKPGYRSAEETPKLNDLIGEDNANKVFSLIEDIRDFYRFDRELSSWHFSTALGGSPSGNKESVIKYWKDQGIDITIEDRDPDTFWYRDEYGDNWEEVYNEEIDCDETD